MRHTILVIDDQWSMQELARVVLQSAGYRVLLAGDMVTGLMLARTEEPDVIILDTRMPEMSAVDFLKGLRQETGTAGIPVIFIANACTGDWQPTEEYHGACLTKPFPPPALVTMVQRALEQPDKQVAV
ncbi:MAG: response regulator [Armatimonadota bacterium]